MTTTVPESRTVTPDPIQIRILQEVADTPNCTISHVVVRLLSGHSESSVRTSVHRLLAKRYLDGGSATSEIRLRITSNGRVALQRSAI
jgi:DNA-binding transcriptional regulator PaaX